MSKPLQIRFSPPSQQSLNQGSPPNKVKIWAKIVALILGSMVVGAMMMAIAISKITIAEFLLNLAPKTYLNGVNILVLGIDETPDVQRSDTIMVVHLDWTNNRIGVLSIPRDTRVYVKGLGLTKINHAYAVGKQKMAKKAVADLLRVPIEYAIVLKLQGVEHIVDQLGGVKINVDKRMVYSDQSGDLHIDLKPGAQTLTGKQAVEYLRFRHDEKADIGRIQRQQSFIRSVADKLTASVQIFEVPILVRQLGQFFETDLSIREMIGLAVQFKEAYKSGSIETATVPGVPTIIDGVSYWRADLKETETVVRRLLEGLHVQTNGPTTKVETVDAQASKETRRRVTLTEVDQVITQTQKNKEELKALGKKIRIEILNGYGSPGIANQASTYLKSLGVEIVRVGNAGAYRYEETLLVDWRGKVEGTLVLARLLSIDPSKIIVYDKRDKPLDATLVLGKDWPSIQAKLQNADQRPRHQPQEALKIRRIFSPSRRP